MTTSIPPAYTVESAPTVVQVPKNNNAIKQPSEPKYCCFKARNYILFVLILRILLFIGAAILCALSIVCSPYALSMKLIGLIITTSAALGIVGVQRRSYAIFAGFLAVDMMTCLCGFLPSLFERFPDAAYWIMVYLGLFFLSPRDELVY